MKKAENNDGVPVRPARKPAWLKVRLGGGETFNRVRGLVERGKLHTVCQEALCPNMGRCWEHGRATLLILGGTCTRACGFCHVAPGKPADCDNDEPRRVAEAVKEMGLKDVVITSVTRDDLPDGGAAVWAETIRRVRAAVAGVCIEALIPDFGGSRAALGQVLAERPDVLGHNLETVPSLYPRVRAGSDYIRSLGILRAAHGQGLVAKTSLMLGLGETLDEVRAVMRQARETGCEIFFAGQYLQPTAEHHPVIRYVEPAEFETLKDDALAMGFPVAVTGPFVRSSYHSDEQEAFLRQRQR